MSVSDVCIRRPVFTWVLVAIPVVLGLVSYRQLGVDLFPNVDFPVCTVTTVLSGASVEEMETTVTKPIEDIINTVSGIDELRSVTTEGVSIVTVQLKDNAGRFSLKVGKVSTGSNRWAVKDGSKTIYSIPSYSADWAVAEVTKFQKAADAGAPAAGDAGAKKDAPPGMAGVSSMSKSRAHLRVCTRASSRFGFSRAG